MTQQRIILGTSIANLLPSVTLLFQDLYYPGEIGTLPLITTPACTAGGFLMQFGSIIGVIYAASMQVQYVLVIKYGWKDKRMRKLEPWLHLVPILFGLGTSIAGLVLKLYNPADWNCWIAPFPYNCTTTYWVNHVEPSMGKTDCVRGDVCFLLYPSVGDIHLFNHFIVPSVSNRPKQRVENTSNGSEVHKREEDASKIDNGKHCKKASDGLRYFISCRLDIPDHSESMAACILAV
ncbi:hypothetical protein ACHAWC_007284 [Mediolabrus comicus]